jgi:hypothetical protein
MRYPFLMVANRTRRWGYGLLLLASASLVAFYVIPAFVASSDGQVADGQCVRRHEVNLDHGEHAGRPWRVNASIEKIERHGHCSYWFLKVQFVPRGVAPGSWTEGWGIPAGGHLPATATIDAAEEEEGQAIGGVVGSRIHSVILIFNGGRRMVVQPKAPSEQLRNRFVWLHDLRYFLSYFPAGEHVRTAKLLDATGKLVFTAHNQEGELIGNMVN